MTDHDDGRAVRLETRSPLHAEHTGTGPAVVLLHAGIADSRMWDTQWATWQGRFALTRLDLRGFGRSGRPVGAFSHAADVLAVLDSSGIDRAALVGASLGGRVALDLAAARPERVSALVLAAPPLPGYEWSDEMRVFSDEEDAALETGDLGAASDVNVDFWLPGASEDVRAAIHEQQLNAFRLQTPDDADESLLADDLVDALPAIEAPTLVVTGERDRADFLAIADRLAATLQDTRRATIPEACHLPSLERPEAFESEVLPFLTEVSRPG
jgi:pimeloyl-ACP methyl ester carboxylesterase